jgi:hypothetical protein
MIHRGVSFEHRAARGIIERSAASGQAAARCWQLLPSPPGPGCVHGRPLRRDGARGLNTRASKSVSVAAAARPGSWLRPTRSAASTGHGLTTLAGHSLTSPCSRRAAARRGSRRERCGPRPAAEGQLVRWLSPMRGVGW